ncbi:F-actin-capping protein subunit alpha [Epithele typhae]|uniref:F-actin-capping protein subunit alpha n=1 Tax=Epithele typhae TaxID=378194 RepID=UPI002007BF22|nr:F-actin-capping protein subunit alpha [Epithele typhae]KAH9925426.1 F-actin-capping protein subunit alpha [Epithele typhae]
MDPAERIEAASKFLLQSPPGEINDVLNDVRNIISDDDQLQEGVLPALREYNVTQFTTAEVPGHQHQSIISEAARIGSSADEEEGPDRYWDPRSRTSFRFDHLSLETSDPEPVEPSEESEPFRAALEKASLDYLHAHYHDGVVSVFATPNSGDRFTIQIVANKYNPNNFWSGRWRSEYVIDTAAKTVQGKILVNVHYYEQGNVQLSTTYTISTPLPPAIVPSGGASAASKVLALVEAEESRYQTGLTDAYAEMGEKTFKGLRRALPMTRSKIDWDRVMGYKLGAELTNSKGVFGAPA